MSNHLQFRNIQNVFMFHLCFAVFINSEWICMQSGQCSYIIVVFGHLHVVLFGIEAFFLKHFLKLFSIKSYWDVC